MDLTDAQAAHTEAVRGRLDDQQAKWLADACQRRPEHVRHGDVRGHAVGYEAGNWPELPRGVGDGKSITRGDVFDITDASALDVFTASYIFGMGKRGYARSRYDKIRAGAPDLSDVLEGRAGDQPVSGAGPRVRATERRPGL